MTSQLAFKAGLGAALLQALASLFCAPAAAQDKEPPPTPFIVQENTIRKLSEHVWEIPDRNRPGVPNVAIIVGSRATLIVDTGMGPKSGSVVSREAQRLSKNT